VALRRAVPAPNDRRLLAPPWAPAGAVLAVLVTAALTRLAWHSRQLPGLDAWVKDRLGASSDRELRLATELAGGLRSVTVLGIVAVAALAWVALRQRNAVILVLLAPTVTLAAERLLKPLVGRRAPESTVVHFPSGHVAVATALALCLVLIVRSVRARPATRTVAVLSAVLLVLLMALVRVVETAHVLSDVVAGAATGVAVTLAVALLLDGRRRAGGGRRRPLRRGRSGRPAGPGARRSGVPGAG
jgi:membrane-associated phospholipid phosphatase